MTSSGTHHLPTSPEATLGALLRQARDQKTFGVPEVARALILSIAQVNGLESGLLTAFHNRTYYLRALKKYMTYLGLPEQEPMISLLAEVEIQATEQTTHTNQNEVSLLVGSVLRHSTTAPLLSTGRLRFLALMIAIVLGIGIIVVMSSEKTSAPLVSQPEPQPDSAVPHPVATESATAPSPQQTVETNQKPAPADDQLPIAAPALNAKMLVLKFAATSWVQFADQRGKRSEKTYTPTDTLEIDPLNLSLLVIGNAPATSVYLGESRLDLGKYINTSSGVARLSQQDLQVLTSP